LAVNRCLIARLRRHQEALVIGIEMSSESGPACSRPFAGVESKSDRRRHSAASAGFSKRMTRAVASQFRVALSAMELN
jgi:hypothetical protein